MPKKERDGDCLISFHRHVDEDGKMNGVAIRCQIVVEEKDLLIRKITAPGRVQ